MKPLRGEVPGFIRPDLAYIVPFQNAQGTTALGSLLPFHTGTGSRPSGVPGALQPILVDRAPWISISGSGARTSCARTGSLIMVGLFCLRNQGSSSCSDSENPSFVLTAGAARTATFDEPDAFPIEYHGRWAMIGCLQTYRKPSPGEK